MKTAVVITDVTRMQGGRVCVGGYLPDDTCVRPVLRVGGLIEKWLYAGERAVVRPFAAVEFDLHEKQSVHPPHTEDRIIDPSYRRPRGVLKPEQRLALLARIDDARVDGIFGAAIHREPGWYVRSGEGARSLGTVSPQQVWEVSYDPRGAGKWEYHLAFADQAGQRYRLGVTDLAFRYFLDDLRTREQVPPAEAARRLTAALQDARVFLRIGLARAWEKYPDRCYLQITGVYSFPDYLDGRCFADFGLLYDVPIRPPVGDKDLPF